MMQDMLSSPGRQPAPPPAKVGPSSEIALNAPLPTALPDVQAFLVRHGAAVEPWRPAAARVDALLSAISERRDDPVFWRELGRLTERLEADNLALHRLDGADALDPTDRGRLLAALRSALQQPGVAPRAAVGTSIRALAGFLVLGMAVACGDKSEDSATATSEEDGGVGGDGASDGTDGTETTTCEAAEERGYSGSEAEVYCELLTLVDGADIGSEARSQLLECFPELSTARRAELLDAFQNASDDELVNLLNSLAYSEECGWVEDGGH